MVFVDPVVKQYLNQFITINIEHIINLGMQTFIHSVGSINLANFEQKGKGVLDTIITHVENQAIISGIKTRKHDQQYFDFIWGIPKDSYVIIDDMPGILDTFESVFKSLYGHTLCVQVTLNKIPHKLIFDYSSTIFAINSANHQPKLLHKYVIINKKKQELDPEECWKYINEVRFSIMGIPMTVRQFLQGKYLLEYIKIAKIYHIDLKRV
jgi:hypothetical protein